MRLLHRRPDGGFTLTSFNDNNAPLRAILSHTWTDGEEVTYNELVAGTGKDKPGYDNIVFCMDRAAQDDIAHCWVDTCCVDKSSSQELQTAINSMFRWYHGTQKCYVYLSDVHMAKEVNDVQPFPISWIEAFQRSKWFTRGWTLQDLNGPSTIEFFSVEGTRLGSKISLEWEICNITGIPAIALRGQSLDEFSFDRSQAG
jgi:hypothetical protein